MNCPTLPCTAETEKCFSPTAELDMLGEMDAEPSYLNDISGPAVPTGPIGDPGPPVDAGPQGLDEFGLPIAPQGVPQQAGMMQN